MAGHGPPRDEEADYPPEHFYENPLHLAAGSSAGATPQEVSRGASFREDGSISRGQAPAMYGLEVGVEQGSYHGGPSANSSQAGSPGSRRPGREIVKKLVRLNTNLRHQLEMEGWAAAADTDGVLTEEELLEAARAQGVLKRKSSAWKWTALSILAIVVASFGIILALVIVGGILVRDIRTDLNSALMTTAVSGNLVANVRAEKSSSLMNWQDEDPLQLMHLSRILLTANDGTILNEQIVTVVADYTEAELFLQTGTGGWVWIKNTTIAAVNLNYYTWSPGQMVWHGNGNGTYLGLGTCISTSPSSIGSTPKSSSGASAPTGAHRRLQQIGVDTKLAKAFKGAGIMHYPAATVSSKSLRNCKGNKKKICGIGHCQPCKK